MAGNLTAKFTASTSDFEKSVSSLKKALSELNQRWLENKETAKENNKEISALKAQQKELNDVIDNGKGTKEHENQLKTLNEKIKAVTEATAILKSEEQLLRVQINGANKELKDQYKELTPVGDKMLTVGSIIKANLISDAIIGGLKRLKDGFTDLIIESSKSANEIALMSSKIGLSIEEVQQYNFASMALGLQPESIVSTMKQLMQAMSSYRLGNQSFVEAFEILNVAVVDGNGELRNRQTVYNEVIESLKAMTNETERSAMAYKVFGMQGLELNTLLSGGAEKIAEISEEVKELGLILSESQIENLKGLNEKIELTKSNFDALGMIVAEVFANSFDEAFEAGEDFIKFIQELKEDGTLGEMAEGLSKAVQNITGVLKAVIPIGWNFRSAILAGITALASYKIVAPSVNFVLGLASAFDKLTKAKKSATVAQHALNTAQKSNLIALGASILIGATAAVISATMATKKANEVTAESVQQSIDKVKSSREEAEELKNLALEYENIRSKIIIAGSGKERLLEIQNLLNEKYIEEADKLDLVKGKYEDNIKVINEYSEKRLKALHYDAINAHTKAEDAYNSNKDFELDSVINEDYNDITAIRQELIDLGKIKINPLDESFLTFEGTPEEQLDSIGTAIDLLIEKGATAGRIFNVLKEEYKKNLDIVENLSNSKKELSAVESLLNGNSEETKENTNRLAKYRKTVNDTTETISDLSKATDEFSDALKEQTENGKIAVDTALALNEAGYSSALVFDKETGAIKLNTEAYKDLIKTKLEIAKAELEQNRLEYAKKWIDKGYYSQEQGYKNAEYLGAAEFYGDLPEELKAEQTQINILESMLKNLENTYENFTSNYLSLQNEFINASNEKIEAIKKEADEAKKANQSQIELINEEIKKRKQLREDSENYRKIKEINAELEFKQLDEISRKELEKEIKRLKEEQAEIEWNRGAENTKDELSKANEKITEKFNADVAEINSALSTIKNITQALEKGTRNISEVVNNYDYSKTTMQPTFNLSGASLTESQMTEMFTKAIYDR